MGEPARVHHCFRVRQSLHERSGASGVVEVHVREEYVVHRVACDAEVIERRQQARKAGRGARVDERRAPRALDDVHGCKTVAHVLGIHGRDAVGMPCDARRRTDCG